MILLESLALYIAIVFVDCKSGSSEVVVTAKNVILAPFKDENIYTKALNKMVEDAGFYKKCTQGIILSVLKLENIESQWQVILPSRK